jgi:hypothetical protein
MVTAQAGTVSTDATTGIQYAPVATTGGGTQAVSGSVQLLDSGGTNKASIDAAGNLATKGGFAEQASLSAGSLNADLVPSTDVSAYKWFSLHATGTFSATCTFQCSNDGVNFVSFSVYQANSNTNFASSFTSTNNMLHMAVFFRYLRVRVTSYTSGTVNGTLELYTSDGYAGVAGIGINAGTNTIGAISNDGTSNTAIAAGTSANTVVKNSSGRLASILVTATGTNALNVYDNASAASGNIIAIIPANATVGTYTRFKVPATAGITVQGNAANPGVTIFYT